MKKILVMLISGFIFGGLAIAQTTKDLQFEWSYALISDLAGFEIAILDNSTTPPTYTVIQDVTDPSLRTIVTSVDLIDGDMDFVILAYDNFGNKSAWSIPKKLQAGQYIPPPVVVDFGPITVLP